MTKPQASTAGRFAQITAAILLSIWMAVAAVRPFVPVLPGAGLDPSWITVMGEAADRHWRMGVDLVFPYGPASSLLTHYYNGNYLALSLPLLLATCVVFGSGAVLALGGATPGSRPRLAALAGLVVTLGLVAPSTADFPDALFLILPWVPALLVLDDTTGNRLVTGFAAVSAGLIGALGLAKASLPVAALPLFLLVDAASLASRRVPVLTLFCLGGVVIGDAAYGQNLSDLPAYLAQQSNVVSGYADAMALDGSRLELLAFGGCAGLLLCLTILSEFRGGHSTRSRAVLPLALAFTMTTLLKAGFIRQDLHTVIAWSGLALLATLVAWMRLRHWRGGVAATVLACAVGGAMVYIPWTLMRDLPSPRARGAIALERHRLIRDPGEQVRVAWALALDPVAFAARLQEDKTKAWRSVADLLPLPHLDGRVDTIPSVQSAILANGLDYRPRPSFQEYSSFGAALLEANRAFLSSPEAPDWILFGPEPGSGSLTLDRRYPNLAEGALWPDLLRFYRPACSIESLVALRRRPVPAEVRLGDEERRSVRFNEAVPIPADTAWFARITVHPTLFGRLAGLLFKPAPVVMTAEFADGHRQDYQLITAIAEAGFVLSPLVTDAVAFVSLSDGRPAPADRAVTSVTLHAPARLQSFFRPDVDLSLQRLAMPAAGSARDPLSPCGPVT